MEQHQEKEERKLGFSVILSDDEVQRSWGKAQREEMGRVSSDMEQEVGELICSWNWQPRLAKEGDKSLRKVCLHSFLVTNQKFHFLAPHTFPFHQHNLQRGNSCLSSPYFKILWSLELEQHHHWSTNSAVRFPRFTILALKYKDCVTLGTFLKSLPVSDSFFAKWD